MQKELSITTGQLADLLKLRSKESFSLLYNCYAGALFGAICRIVKDKTVAEDLLQDTFVKIWKKIDSYDAGKGTLFTWMLKIAHHICFDFLRSKYHSQKMKEIDDGCYYCEILASTFDPHVVIIKTELALFTQKLEVKYRKVIEMIYFRGYTHEEVALILDIPVGTVKTRSRNGLKQLRNLYD